jgi:hypothetical protein
MLLRNDRIQRLGGGWLERLVIGITARFELLRLRQDKDPNTLQLLRKIRRQRKWLLTASEGFIVHSIAKAQSKRQGALAEVGVFEGGSARMLCEAKGDRVLHLFDTFEGLPEACDLDSVAHKENKNLYACSLESVQEYLKDFKNVMFHKGLFPESARPIDNEKFSFVHFDVDLHKSTLSCLEYFYTRMIPGGIMLSHDYSILRGVRTAFTEFLEDKPEAVIELPTTQCMVVKL